MLQQGKSRQEVVDFMVARYGDFVLYRPQFKSSTYLLWLGPFLLLVVVLVIVMRRLRAAAEPLGVDADILADAKSLLETGDEPVKADAAPDDRNDVAAALDVEPDKKEEPDK